MGVANDPGEPGGKTHGCDHILCGAIFNCRNIKSTNELLVTDVVCWNNGGMVDNTIYRFDLHCCGLHLTSPWPEICSSHRRNNSPQHGSCICSSHRVYFPGRDHDYSAIGGLLPDPFSGVGNPAECVQVSVTNSLSYT